MCRVLHTDIMVLSFIPLGCLHLFFHRLLHSASFDLDQVSKCNSPVLSVSLRITSKGKETPAGSPSDYIQMLTSTCQLASLQIHIPFKWITGGLHLVSMPSPCSPAEKSQNSAPSHSFTSASQSFHQISFRPAPDRRSRGFRCRGAPYWFQTLVCRGSTLGSCWSVYPSLGASDSPG